MRPLARQIVRGLPTCGARPRLKGRGPSARHFFREPSISGGAPNYQDPTGLQKRRRFKLRCIAICNMFITNCNKESRLKLADKIRYLREVEGSLRSLGRAMTQRGTGPRDRRGDQGEGDFAVVYLADRVRCAAAPDEYDAAAAGEILQGPSWLPGRGPGGFSGGVADRRGYGGPA